VNISEKLATLDTQETGQRQIKHMINLQQI